MVRGTTAVAGWLDLESIFKEEPKRLDMKKELKYSTEQAAGMARKLRHVAKYIVCLAVVNYSFALLLYSLAFFHYPLMGFMEAASIRGGERIVKRAE